MISSRVVSVLWWTVFYLVCSFLGGASAFVVKWWMRRRRVQRILNELSRPWRDSDGNDW